MVAMSPWPSMPKPTTGLPVLAMPSTTRLGPAVLDADHDHGGDVGVGAGADQRAEVQIEVGAELQPAVGMRDRQRALDVVGDRLAGRVGEIVERQDDDVVAHADAAVLAPPAAEAQVAPDLARLPLLFAAIALPSLHQRLVLRFCTCTCSPTPASATMRPISSPYLMTVSPFLSAFSATLWPIGMCGFGLELERLVGLGDDAQHVGPGFQALDHDDADVVLRAVHQKVR